MSRGSAETAGSTSAADAARAWREVRGSDEIQFAPVTPPKPPETPEWLEALGRFLQSLFEPVGRALGVSWPTIETILLALLALGVLYLAWRLLWPLAARRRGAAEAPEEWQPERSRAMALLADADRLAAEGLYDEAVHLLLRRSVGEIAEAQPDWLEPASTAREIATLPQLPSRARQAFAVIADRVERSRYALRGLAAGDWQAARAAYAEFALAGLARTA